jgi:uncharacterized damage-inducible protein DinB
MSTSAVDAFRMLQPQKEFFLGELSPWNSGQLRFSCKPESWSALQVLDHVVRTERGILSEMQKNVQRCERVPVVQRLRSDLLIQLMRSPARVQVPRPVARFILPGDALDLAELTAAWNDSQAKLSQWAGQVREEETAYAAFRHPASGWMSALQGVLFLAAHARHHRYQLGRIRRSAGWKRAG